MSAKATFWAWDQAIKPATAKLVLLCLADCHNGDTGRCNPSAEYIAKQTGLNRKTVLAQLQNLEQQGALTTEKRHGTSNQYSLQTSTNIGTGTEIGTGTKNGTGVVPKTGLPPVPKTVLEPTTKPTKNLIVMPEGVNAAAYSEWLEFRKAKGKPVSPMAANKQFKMLLDYDRPTQQQIIDTSITNDYQGLFPPKGRAAASAPAGSSRGRSIEEDLRDTSWAN